MATAAPKPVAIHIPFKHTAIVVAVLVALIACVRIFGMHFATVGAGEEIVFVDTPYFWGKPGVRDVALAAGRSTEFNSTTEIHISTVPILRTLTFVDLPARNGILVNIKYSAVFKILNAPALVERFGVKWYEVSVEPRLTSITRDVMDRNTALDLVGEAKSIKQAEVALADTIREMLVDAQLPVELTTLSIQQVSFHLIAKPSATTPKVTPKKK